MVMSLISSIDAHVSNRPLRWSLTTKASVSSMYGSENSVCVASDWGDRCPSDPHVALAGRHRAHQLAAGPLGKFHLHAEIAGKQVRELDVEADQVAAAVTEDERQPRHGEAHAQACHAPECSPVPAARALQA